MKALSPKREGKDFPNVPVNKKNNPKNKNQCIDLVLWAGQTTKTKTNKKHKTLVSPQKACWPSRKMPGLPDGEFNPARYYPSAAVLYF